MKIFLTVLAYVGLALVLFSAILMFYITIDTFTAPATTWEKPSSHNPYDPYEALEGLFYVLWRATPLLYLYFSLIAVLGVILTLVGGIAVRPRYLWISLIAVGALYVLSSSGLFFHIYMEYIYPSFWNKTLLWVFSLISLAPGLACIVEGILIRKPKKKIQNPA
jgi:hypothetical protein